MIPQYVSPRAVVAVFTLFCLTCITGVFAQAEHTPNARSSQPDPSIAFFTKTTGAAWKKSNDFLAGQHLAIRLKDLPPGKKVTLKASWEGCKSSGVFEVDSKGNVDLTQSESLDGSYRGIDADGMIWSMRCPPDEAKPSDDIEFSAEIDGKSVAQAVLQRVFLPRGITVTDVKFKNLAGKFYQPKGPGPFPAVILVGGSEGGLGSAGRAAYLATRGYAVLVLGYFKAQGTPKSLKNIELDDFGKAIDWLQDQKSVQADKLGVWGLSRGGELALLLGAQYPQIKAVVGVVPSGVVWAGLDADDEEPTAWTLHGKALPNMSQAGFKFEDHMVEVKGPDGKKAFRITPAFQDALKDAKARARAAIAVEKTKGPVLLIGAKADDLWPSCALSQIAFDRLKAAGREYPDQIECIPKAGHGIVGLPGFPTTFPFAYEPEIGGFMAMGGEPARDGRGQRRALELIDAFLDKALREDTNP